METSEVRRLWGHEFRVVANGLAEEDVALFVEWLMRKYQASLEKSSHIEPLHQLANKTVQEAERMAVGIKEKAERESQRRSAEIVSEAEHAGREIVELASRAASALEDAARRKVQEKFSELDETLLTMKKWADEEFGKLKEHEEGMRVFHSTFQGFLRLLESGIEPDEPDEPGEAGAGDADNQSPRFPELGHPSSNGGASEAFEDSEGRSAPGYDSVGG